MRAKERGDDEQETRAKSVPGMSVSGAAGCSCGTAGSTEHVFPLQGLERPRPPTEHEDGGYQKTGQRRFHVSSVTFSHI